MVFPLDEDGAPIEPEDADKQFPEPLPPLRPITDDTRPMSDQETSLMPGEINAPFVAIP